MKTLLLTVMLAGLGVSGSLLFAAEPAPKSGTASASAATPATATTKDAKPAATATEPHKADPVKADAKSSEPASKPATTPADDEEKAPAPSTADKGPSPQRFTPSEQVRADFDVSFPVDI